MRELNWTAAARRPATSVASRAHPRDGLGRSLWEDGLTLALAAAAFLCVAANVQHSDWVAGLPALYPIGLGALAVAYGLSRVRLNQALLIPAGLFVGAGVVYAQVMAILAGGSLFTKTDHLLDRMYVWWSALTQQGASVDPLPVILIMLTATWVGSFIAAWAIFRWRNAPLGLIPGAAALIWDSGFSNSEFSISAVLYVIIGVLLIMRLRVASVQGRWEREETPYPRFIALSVLNVTFWATCALLAAASVLPVGAQSGPASSGWSTLTGPLTSRLTPIAGAFIGINPDKGLKIHALKDALILQGGIDPSIIPAAQVEAELPPDVAPFLRDQSFDQYRRDGWSLSDQDDAPLPAGESSDAASSDSGIDPLLRKSVAVQVKVQGGNGDRLLSVGQPLRSDEDARSISGADPADVSSLQAEDHLSNGTAYTVVGSVSAATVEQLRAAGTAYPGWVTQNYLQTSRHLPPRVGDKARELTSDTTNPYDAAAAIERYLRTFPEDYGISPAPGRQDPVDYFLFDAQRGYYDYYASAMTVMLRTLGIPARLAAGYVIDPARQDGDGGAYKLTQAQAFAWPEVYFPSVGWVEFNPTPSQPLVPRPAAPQTQPPPEPELTIASDDSGSDYLPLRSLPGIDRLAPDLGWDAWRTIILAGVSILVGGTLLALAIAWELRVRGLGLEARLWEKSLALASLGHAGPHAHETPRDFAERLAATVPGAAGIVRLAAGYERARFSNRPASHDDARSLRDAWSSTRIALLRRMLRVRDRRHSAAAQADGDGAA